MSALGQYFLRIGFTGDAAPNLATLNALHSAHATSVPFENIDVQLACALTTDIDAAFDKIVTRRRGGWCYEQNGLFGWALSQIGFRVTRLSASVMRQVRGDIATASHLCLLVHCDDEKTPFLADVGFGGSMLGAIPLEQADHLQPPFRLGLRKLEDGYWRFWENMGDGEFGFDFLAEPANETALAEKCAYLQSDPASHFVLNLSVQQRSLRQHRMLRGRVLTLVNENGVETNILNSPDGLVDVLKRKFNLDTPEIASQWPKIVARHSEVFAAENEANN